MRTNILLGVSLLAFMATTNSMELLCKFKKTGLCFNWMKQKYKNCSTCEIRNANLKKTTERIHIASLATNVDYLRVELNGGVINFVPNEIFTIFPEITELGIKGTSSISLQSGFFSESNELKVFDCKQNSIKSLGADLFIAVQSLEVLDLARNSIEEIHSDAFRTLFKLRTLALDGNKIVKLNYLWFQDLNKLHLLDFSENSIQEIDGKILRKLKKLKLIFLSKNQITKLDKLAFKENTGLELVDLSENKLSEIPPKVFVNLKDLKDLGLLENICINDSFIFVNSTTIEKALEPCKPITIQSNQEGSCEIPLIANGKIVNEDNETEIVGSFYGYFEPIRVVCDINYTLLIRNLEEKKDIYCSGSVWQINFPQCLKLCPISQITGPTTKMSCELNGETIDCKEFMRPETKATIDCNSGYKKPGHIQTAITCLESGSWSNKPFKCEPVCGTSSERSTEFIYHGTTADISDVPWHVAIYRNRTQICGGSIINEKIIVSAAHCFYEDNSQAYVKNDPTIFQVVAGKNYKNYNATEARQTQIFNLAEIIIDGRYKGFYEYYLADIALLVLKGFIKYMPHIKPVCLELPKVKAQIANGTLAIVAGWGVTELRKQSEVLKKIQMPVIDYNLCVEKAPFDYRGFIIPDKLCAGYADGSGVCQGDSGGGLTIPKNIGGEDTYFIHGIVSNGKRDVNTNGCDQRIYNVFTNVQDYSSMIQKTIADYPFL